MTRAERTLSELPRPGGRWTGPPRCSAPSPTRAVAIVLHALRLTIGDEAFFAGLRTWVATYLDGAATTLDFQTMMETTSGADLDRFFDALGVRRCDPVATARADAQRGQRRRS